MNELRALEMVVGMQLVIAVSFLIDGLLRSRLPAPVKGALFVVCAVMFVGGVLLLNAATAR